MLLSEFEMMHSGMMEKFDMLLRTLESQEKDRTEKGPVMESSLVAPIDFGLTQTRAGGSHNDGGGSGGDWRIEPCIRKLGNACI